jgi:AGCS family alanine or glycine:cation symporter
MDILLNLNNTINKIIWGPLLITLIIGVGLYISIGIKFLQIRHLGKVFKETFLKAKKPKEKGGGAAAAGAGDISPFQALNVALGGTVGVGNIAGVATAIALGGPGAIFWMWVSGVLGMATKFAEVVLSINYREREEGGPMIGGPMMYIKKGLPKVFHPLAYIFAVFGALAAFGIGNMAQANSVADGTLQFGIPRHFTALLLIVAVGLVTIGGIKRIAQVAMVCVPFMCILYFISGIAILLINIRSIPDAIWLILRGAFTGQAAAGGFAGATVTYAIRYGIARGVFSNEAGLGSAPIAHSTAKTDNPVKQGFWGIMEVFIDTIVICTTTALVIITTGSWASGNTGAMLTMEAFSKFFGKAIGYSIVVFCMVLTAYDTNLAWCFYGETCTAFLLGHNTRIFYRILWLPFVLIGALGKLEVIWNICDTLNGLMALPNIIALIILGPVVFKLTKNYLNSEATTG